jgi:GDPmannose 4,6-dehydratase
MSKQVALITGITGQTGSYLAEFLLSKDYEVHGIVRRSSSFNTERIDHIFNKLNLHFGDLSDNNLSNIIYDIRPDEIYNLGAQSHVKVSFEIPEYTGDIDALGFVRILETVRRDKMLKTKTKIYQASSSEMFGDSPPPQNENTPMLPNSPYACAKLYSYLMGKSYRTAYNMYIYNGILFNHESARRGRTFVTRKITKHLADYLAGKQKVLYIGNLYAKRDWGFAPDYVECIWKILQESSPDDIVIGTGESYTIKDFINKAFSYAGLPINWSGSGMDEVGKIYGNKTVVKVSSQYFRPNEVTFLQADNTKALKLLNWKPKVKFDKLVEIMVDCDLLRNGLPSISTIPKIFEWSKIL